MGSREIKLLTLPVLFLLLSGLVCPSYLVSFYPYIIISFVSYSFPFLIQGTYSAKAAVTDFAPALAVANSRDCVVALSISWSASMIARTQTWEKLVFLPTHTRLFALKWASGVQIKRVNWVCWWQHSTVLILVEWLWSDSCIVIVVEKLAVKIKSFLKSYV